MDFDIRFIKDSEIDQVKSLFCLCFGSELDEANIFFRPRQKKIVGAFSGITLCSMMTIFDCEAVFTGKTVSAGYIAGVATAPEYRGNKLFQKCFDFFCEQDHNFMMLFCIPATPSLFQLYKNAGLDKTTYIKQSYFTGSGDVNNIKSSDKISEINDNRELVIKKPTELSTAVTDAFLYYGGKIITDENFIAFVYENKDEITVADIITNNYNTAIEQVLKRIESGKRVRVILPNNHYTLDINGEIIPIAACKVLNNELKIDELYINMLFNEI